MTWLEDVNGEFISNRTRQQNIENKKKIAITLPVALAGINFADGNVGFLARAAACFGAERLLIIGSLPSERQLRMFSVGLHQHIEILQFSRPSDFLRYCREIGYYLVALEIIKGAVDLQVYRFQFDKPTCIIAGNETTGVPGEIIFHSDVVHIPMLGVGTCLNTSQAANIALYEYSRQYMGEVLNG